MKTNKSKRFMFALVALLILLFIWGQSLLPLKSSATESNWLRETVINPIFRFLGLTEMSDCVLRKAAHVIEFLLLSVFTALCLKGKVLCVFLLCFIAAFLDETIQIFADRGAQISDVWIDLIGIIMGTALGWAIIRRENHINYF